MTPQSATPRTAPLPPSLPAGVVPPSLDEQILLAEYAVINRHERIREHGRRIGEQLHRKLPTMGAGAASVVGGLLMRRAMRQRRQAPTLDSRPSWIAQLPWTQLSAFLWPLLPLGLRSRLNPGMVATLMAAAVPLAAARLRKAPPLQTAPQVDLQRYAGHWYEIARLPLHQEARCDSDVSATYTYARGRLRVLNRCRDRDGRSVEVRGIARRSGADGSRLELSFAPRGLRWLPLSWAPYWILHVDPDYDAAVVGTPDRTQLWLLSRQPQMDDTRLQRLLLVARLQGFDTARLLRTPHGRG